MSDFEWAGKPQPLVFVRFLAMYSDDTEVLRIHREWADVRHPIMLCHNHNCINPKHMRIGRMSIEGDLFEHEYAPDSVTLLQEDFAIKAQHRLERAQANRDMAKIEDIRQTMKEMSDEDLLEIVKGNRSLRREAIETAKSTPKKRAAPKKKDRAGDVKKVASSMTKEQRMELLKELGLI